MCELRQETRFKVTPGEAAKLKEIIFQIDELLLQLKELEKKRVLWWENQLSLAGFGEGEYQWIHPTGICGDYRSFSTTSFSLSFSS